MNHARTIAIATNANDYLRSAITIRPSDKNTHLASGERFHKILSVRECVQRKHADRHIFVFAASEYLIDCDGTQMQMGLQL